MKVWESLNSDENRGATRQKNLVETFQFFYPKLNELYCLVNEQDCQNMGA